jgi:hypothetical protein
MVEAAHAIARPNDAGQVAGQTRLMHIANPVIDVSKATAQINRSFLVLFCKKERLASLRLPNAHGQGKTRGTEM